MARSAAPFQASPIEALSQGRGLISKLSAWRRSTGARLTESSAGRIPSADLANVPRSAAAAETAVDRLLSTISSLRWTSAAIASTLVLGLAAVVTQPRPRAVGLARLLVASDLLQSFPVDRAQPVPELWTQRLGAEAGPLWRQARGSWWQLWSGHDDGGAALVLEATTLANRKRPSGSFTVDDLVVIAPDALAADDLQRPLRLSHRPLQGLEQRCMERLQQGQAVYWSNQGLAGVLGPLTPLLMRWQQGCLSLEFSSDRLAWNGEASAVTGLAAERPAPVPLPAEGNLKKTLPPGTVLALSGPRLELLLGSLLSRSLVRDALQEQYGLDQDTLRLLSTSRFALQLRSLPKGPFRLGLTLNVDLSQQRRAWIRAMGQLEQSIRRQGLQPIGPEAPEGPVANRGVLPLDQTWRRADGVVVGGWRWLSADSRSPKRPTRLVLFLGPAPAPAALSQVGWPAQDSGRLELVLLPRPLAAEGVMPASLPPLVNAAQTLQMISGGQGSGPRTGTVSPLWGELRLGR